MAAPSVQSAGLRGAFIAVCLVLAVVLYKWQRCNYNASLTTSFQLRRSLQAGMHAFTPKDVDLAECLDIQNEEQVLQAQKRHVLEKVDALRAEVRDYPKACKAMIENVTQPQFLEIRNTFIVHDQCVYTANAAIAGITKQEHIPVNNDNYKAVTLGSREPKGKDRVAIVVDVTVSTMRKYASQLISLSCYATLHKFQLHLEIMPLQQDRDDQRAKVRTILKYLPHYQWVVHLDPATRVVNYKRSLKDFLDDKADVILLQRGAEVASFHIAFKRSDFSVKFIQDWMDMGKKKADRKNSANGDLLDLLVVRYFPKEAEKMPDRGRGAEPSWTQYEVFKSKFGELFWGRNLDEYMPVKVYKEGQGLINYGTGPAGVMSHEQVFETLTEDELYCRPSLLYN